MRLKLLLSNIALLVFLYSAQAHTTDHYTKGCKKNTIAGGVCLAGSKKPISKVFVTAYSNSKKEKVVFTDLNGNYDLDDLKPGTYTLVFEKAGFEKLTREKVMIRQDGGCMLNVELQEATADFQILPGQIVISEYLPH